MPPSLAWLTRLVMPPLSTPCKFRSVYKITGNVNETYLVRRFEQCPGHPPAVKQGSKWAASTLMKDEGSNQKSLSLLIVIQLLVFFSLRIAWEWGLCLTHMSVFRRNISSLNNTQCCDVCHGALLPVSSKLPANCGERGSAK